MPRKDGRDRPHGMDDMPDHRHRGRKNPEHGRQNSRTDRPDGELRDGPRRTGAGRGPTGRNRRHARRERGIRAHEQDHDGTRHPYPARSAPPATRAREYAATAENLYHDLIAGRPSAGSTDGHVLIRLAQAVNRAWAELTLANGTSQAFHAGDIDG